MPSLHSAIEVSTDSRISGWWGILFPLSRFERNLFDRYSLQCITKLILMGSTIPPARMSYWSYWRLSLSSFLIFNIVAFPINWILSWCQKNIWCKLKVEVASHIVTHVQVIGFKNLKDDASNTYFLLIVYLGGTYTNFEFLNAFVWIV